MRPELLTAADLRAFGEGRDHRAHEKLGAHLYDSGVAFAVWAPEAERVSVIGDFNGWSADASPLARIDGTGAWQALVPAAGRGQRYKYRIVSRHGGNVWAEGKVGLGATFGFALPLQEITDA